MSVDHRDIKEGMRSMWAEGDWPAIAAHLDDAARVLVDECGVGPGHTVLDVAAGNGNVAVWAARAGAKVVATDLSPLLVEQGKRRCEVERLEVHWREADMEDLPFADDSFDSVLSAFGIGFATRPAVALAELFRVARPGGCVGLANWTRDGWPAHLGAIMERHLLPASVPAAQRPQDNGGAVGLWLVEHAAALRMERGVVWERFASPEAWWEHWHTCAPQMAFARRMLSDEQYRGLRDDLIAALSVADAKDGTGCRWASEYLVVVAAKRPAANGRRANGHAAARRQKTDSSAW